MEERGSETGVKGSTPYLVERERQERETDDEGATETRRDSKQVFSCAMHNEERQTAYKGPTNEALVIHTHSG